MIELYGVLLLVAGGIPYFFYLLGIKYGKTQTSAQSPTKYPAISIVISAYNESANIERRITNLSRCTYWGDIEIVFVNDCSDDATEKLARYYLDKYFFDYQFINNTERLGTGRAYTKAMRIATNNIIVVTDADVEFKQDALLKIINRLLNEPDVAAVTGDLQPFPTQEPTSVLEGEYRNIYGQMGEWESANGSTINFNGALMAFKKDVVPLISENGAEDFNIASSTVRAGYRALYEKEAVVYETIPNSFKAQYRQKSRRATQLIESLITNKDVVVTTRFYLMRAWMVIASPILFTLGSILLIFNIPSLLLLLLALTFSGFARSFIFSQFALLNGLLNYGTDLRSWDSTSSLEAKE